MFQDNPFLVKQINIPHDAQIVFVADMFIEDYVGGAELTTQSIIDASPFKVFKVKSSDVTMQLLQQGSQKLWIFGNYAQLNFNLIPTIIGNLRYVILEYDYKYCVHRSPEKHMTVTGSPCDCHNARHGKLVSAFYHGSRAIWWMSEAQRERYHTLFPFLDQNDSNVLSSVFDAKTLVRLRELREENHPRSGWIVLGSPSWVKGYEDALAYCQKNSLEHEVLWNVPYDQLLEKLSKAEGFVYLPRGADTCPRMVIEAKLLGCKLVLNDYVQHRSEDWFSTDDLIDIERYLYAATKVFWSTARRIIEHQPTISGYSTTLNCIKQDYPFVQSIKSMLKFCSEVCIVDGGSTDGTLQKLAELQREFVNDDVDLTSSPIDQLIDNSLTRVKVKVVERDWNHPRFAVFDGQQKAEARKMCTMELCWQMDSDEIVHEEHVKQIHHLASHLPPQVQLLALPVVEYWGGSDKVRIDITPWKWRLSRNLSHITHGIPRNLRRKDSQGNLYAAEGTDGCDMIHVETGETIPCLTFWTNDLAQIRDFALQQREGALDAYQQVINKMLTELPCVFHYSWFNLERKIKLYRDYWTTHWQSLYDKTIEDTAETNMFFDVPWSSVTDEMIRIRAKELAQTGGHIWHKKWDGRITPWITVSMSQPEVMRCQ